jgi:O-glycosyl hydrolase
MSLNKLLSKAGYFFLLTVVTGFILTTCVSDPSRIRPQDVNLVITIDTDTKFQYVRGFGGMDVGWRNFPHTLTRDTELMYNPDTGLGLNILRIMIMPWNTDINETMRQLVSEDRPYYYENVKIVNKYGGYVLASPWTPPIAWKSNNSHHTRGDGRLLREHYQDYANYLRAFSQNMLDNGAPIYVVSIQNEPNYGVDYDGCLWSGTEMMDFFLQVGHFTTGVRGFGGGVEIESVRTMNGESANNTNINDAALNNPESRAVIDIIGRHTYGNQQIRYARALDHPTDPKEVWMTEKNINSGNEEGYFLDSTWDFVWKFMNDVDLSIRLNDESAYIWWAAKRFYSFIGDGQYGTIDGAILPRGYAISHYAKFAKETYRVGVTIEGKTGSGTAVGSGNINNRSYLIDSVAAKATAFVSPDGNTISIVMFTPTFESGEGGVDMGKIKIQLPEDFIIREAAAMRSSKNNYAKWENVEIGEDRNSAYVVLPRSHILSVRFTR